MVTFNPRQYYRSKSKNTPHEKFYTTAASVIAFAGCTKKEDNETRPAPVKDIYFPPVDGSDWDTLSIAGMGWNQNAVQPLRDFLVQKNTKSFMILVNGRIVMEEYFERS